VQEIAADQPLPGAEAWSPDGRFMIVNSQAENRTWLLPMTGERKLQPVLEGAYSRGMFRISSDGRKVAWAATEGSRTEVYFADFPTFAGKRQISTEGGSEPEWSATGQELFYRKEKQLTAVDLRPATFLHSKVLFAANLPSLGPQYAPSPDGKRFLLNESTKPLEESQIVVALHWQDISELR
jgi:hypothetical protein